MAGGRKHKRYSMRSLNLSAVSVFVTKVELVNISVEGACIKSPKRLQSGSTCVLTLEDKGSSSPLQGTIMWESLSEHTVDLSGEIVSRYTAGVKFDKMFTQLTENMKMLVENLPFKGYRVSSTRFVFHTRVTASLEYHEQFRVKSMSLGGLLMESLNEIPKDSELALQIKLPGRSRPLSSGSKVASCVLVDGGVQNANRFDIGVEFVDISKKDSARLKKVLESLSAL